MTAWAIAIFILMGISVVAGVLLMATGAYPRVRERWQDAISILVNIALLVWGAIAIWGTGK